MDILNLTPITSLFILILIEKDDGLHIPADPRSPFPVISVHLVCNLQYRWQS